MALGINTNLSMLNASRGINSTQKTMSDAMKKLASGKKINSAADNPAGLVISEKMNAKLMGLGAAVASNEMTSNMVRTAEASAGQMSDLLNKARGLLVDMANSGVNDADMNAANQSRLNELVDGISGIAKNAQFGSKKLFDGNLTLTPMTSPDGKTASVEVPALSAENLGGDAQSGGKFNNLEDLKSGVGAGDISEALAVVDKAIGEVSQFRGKMGALEADFINPTNDTFQSAYSELQSGVSSIVDSDFALETSKVTGANIQSQIKLALMAQGKESSQTLLQLLR